MIFDSPLFQEISADTLNELCLRGERLLDNAFARNGCECFELLPSYIQPGSSPVRDGAVLLVDVGGTYTKVAARRSLSGTVSWTNLFSLKNEDIARPKETENSFSVFLQSLAERVTEIRSFSEPVLGCGIVWSNALESRQIPGVGIGGNVTGRAKYHKSEWFIDSLVDGESVDVLFRSAFERAGLQFSHFVIANDTPLTMKALDGANAGMVLSTGANATLVSPGIGICNAEMGGRFVIPENLALPGDLIVSQDGESLVSAKTIEELIAGKFLPQLFAGHILLAKEHRVPELSEVADFLSGRDRSGLLAFQGEDLALLHNGSLEAFRSRWKAHFHCSRECLLALQQIAGRLLDRSAKFAAVLVWCSLRNQFGSGNKLSLALDSSVASGSPAHFRALQRTAEQLLEASGECVEISLLRNLDIDSGSISVPMQGAARALDDFIDG